MALPTVVGVSASAATATTGTTSPALPSGWAADDGHFLGIQTQDASPVGAITGWTDVITSQLVSTGTITRLTVRFRRAVAGDTAPTVPASSNHTISRIIGIRGLDTSVNPWNITSAGTDTVSSTSLSIAGATTTVDECLVLLIFATGVDSNTAQLSGSFTNANLANIATQCSNWTNVGGGGGFAIGTGEQAIKGAYGATTATLVTAAQKAMATIALAPVASGQVAADPIRKVRSPRPIEQQAAYGPYADTPTPGMNWGG
jgi:hypothetical protein